jgi:hypothetical protein
MQIWLYRYIIDVIKQKLYVPKHFLFWIHCRFQIGIGTSSKRSLILKDHFFCVPKVTSKYRIDCIEKKTIFFIKRVKLKNSVYWKKNMMPNYLDFFSVILLQISDRKNMVGLWCLMPLSTTLYHIMLYRVHLAMNRVRTDNFSGEKYERKCFGT